VRYGELFSLKAVIANFRLLSHKLASQLRYMKRAAYLSLFNNRADRELNLAVKLFHF
jgi:hypothetical protein